MVRLQCSEVLPSPHDATTPLSTTMGRDMMASPTALILRATAMVGRRPAKSPTLIACHQDVSVGEGAGVTRSGGFGVEGE